MRVISLSTFYLKVLAVIFMLIDHIGFFFFPDVVWLRIIGRLSFPLFAWLIVNGIEYSRDQKKYFMRLLLFALLSQIPYNLAYRSVIPNDHELNIFFTLVLGFVSIQAYRVIPNRIYGIFCVCVLALFAAVIQSSYGAGGVFCVFLFYLFRKNTLHMFFSQLSLFFVLFSLPTILIPSHFGNIVGFYQALGALSVFLIAFYNHLPGPRIKYFFYAFYPLHLLVIYWVYETFH